jgi:hypothetical protein
MALSGIFQGVIEKGVLVVIMEMVDVLKCRLSVRHLKDRQPTDLRSYLVHML